ncbi:13697_t:CDS:2 [Entrophospora sp. SA101]|nr:13697_t:CDS:2 [Entrophospora sp. SA101]
MVLVSLIIYVSERPNNDETDNGILAYLSTGRFVEDSHLRHSFILDSDDYFYANEEIRLILDQCFPDIVDMEEVREESSSSPSGSGHTVPDLAWTFISVKRKQNGFLKVVLITKAIKKTYIFTQLAAEVDLLEKVQRKLLPARFVHGDKQNIHSLSLFCYLVSLQALHLLNVVTSPYSYIRTLSLGFRLLDAQ